MFRKLNFYPKLDANRENIVYSVLIFTIFATSYFNFLLFHSLVEILSVIVAFLIFILTLNAYKRLDNSFILIIGTSFLFVGLLDLLHAFSYSGLNVFPRATSDLPTQLWISARYLQSFSMFIALLLINKKTNFSKVFTAYTITFVLLIFSIFFLKNFPAAYIEGQGLTPFKVNSEYFISFLFFVSFFLLYANRKELDEKIFKLLNYSLALTIFAELTFTLYVSVYSYINAIGHFFKLISFYLIYKAIVEVSIKEPHRIMYRNLKQSEKKYSDLFAFMSSGFALHKIVLDKYGNPIDYVFIEANKAFEKMTGLKKDDIIGKKVTEVIPDIENDPFDWIGKYGRVAYYGENIKFEQFSKALNKYFSVIAYSPFHGYFATIFDDITKEKEIDQAKSEFVSFVSHELKTPLTSMQLNTDLLLMENPCSLTKEQRESLEMLKETTNEMADFINTLLNVSKIESGKIFLNNEPMDVAMQLNILLKKFESLFVKKSIRVRKQYSSNMPIISIDEKIFDLIFNNLLTNAARYTPKEGVVKIKAEKKDDYILVEVNDTGLGIPEKDKDKIFSKLFRAENVVRTENQGTGLGLYIVKKMTEKIGAEIWFESKLNIGTSFFVKLPLNKFKI